VLDFLDVRNDLIDGELFGRLGFESAGDRTSDGEQRWRLAVARYASRQTFIRRRSGQP